MQDSFKVVSRGQPDTRFQITLVCEYEGKMGQAVVDVRLQEPYRRKSAVLTGVQWNPGPLGMVLPAAGISDQQWLDWALGPEPPSPQPIAKEVLVKTLKLALLARESEWDSAAEKRAYSEEFLVLLESLLEGVKTIEVLP